MQFFFTFSLFCAHFCNLWNDLTLEIDLMIIHIIHCSCNLAFEIHLSTYLFRMYPRGPFPMRLPFAPYPGRYDPHMFYGPGPRFSPMDPRSAARQFWDVNEQFILNYRPRYSRGSRGSTSNNSRFSPPQTSASSHPVFSVSSPSVSCDSTATTTVASLSPTVHVRVDSPCSPPISMDFTPSISHPLNSLTVSTAAITSDSSYSNQFPNLAFSSVSPQSSPDSLRLVIDDSQCLPSSSVTSDSVDVSQTLSTQCLVSAPLPPSTGADLFPVSSMPHPPPAATPLPTLESSSSHAPLLMSIENLRLPPGIIDPSPYMDTPEFNYR